jgi:hypothetical protein
MRISRTFTLLAFLSILILGCTKDELPELNNPNLEYKDSTDLTTIGTLTLDETTIDVGAYGVFMGMELNSTLYRNLTISSIAINIGTYDVTVNDIAVTNNGKKCNFHVFVPRTLLTGNYDVKATITTASGKIIVINSEQKLYVQSLNTKRLYITSLTVTALQPQQSTAFSATYNIKLKDRQTGSYFGQSTPHAWSWNGNQWTTNQPLWTINPSIELPNYQTTGYVVDLFTGAQLKGSIILNLNDFTTSVTTREFTSANQTLNFTISGNFEWK